MWHPFKPRLNKNKFRRDKTRRFVNNGIFNDAEVSINWLSRVVISLFFTPVVAVTSLFAKNSIAAYANIFLCACHILNFLYNAIFRYTSPIDSILTLLGLIAAASIAIIFTANFFPVAITFSSIFFSCNVIATAINSFFAIKGVIIPPIKKLCDISFKFIGVNFNSNLYVQKDLRLPEEHCSTTEDRDVIKKLHKSIAKSERDGFTKKDTLPLFNNILHMLLKYINKYNEAPLGNIRNQDSIKNFEKLIERLTDAGDMTGAVQKFNDKISFKESRLKRYERFKSKLANMETNQDLEAFSHSVKPYLINFKQVNTQEEKHKLLEATYKELDQQISKYKTDIEQLKACIPSHYFKNLRSTN